MAYFNIVAQSSESTVVTEYTPKGKRSEGYQSEAQLEALIEAIKDGTAVKVDGFTVYTERGREWLLKFADEGIFEKARELGEAIIESKEYKELRFHRSLI